MGAIDVAMMPLRMLQVHMGMHRRRRGGNGAVRIGCRSWFLHLPVTAR